MRYFHAALSVKSISESQKFFEDIFNFTFMARGERPEMGVRFVMLEEKNTGVIIELFEHYAPQPLTEDLMDFQKVGIKHIAFVVENIEEIIDRIKKNGGKIIWQPKKGVTVKRIAFVADPNNIPIELVEL